MDVCQDAGHKLYCKLFSACTNLMFLKYLSVPGCSWQWYPKLINAYPQLNLCMLILKRDLKIIYITVHSEDLCHENGPSFST